MVYLEALAGIALSLSVLMAIAGLVQQRTGNSGWVDTIWTFSVGLVGAGSALWPIGGAAPNPPRCLVGGLAAVSSLGRCGPISSRAAGVHDDPRSAGFAHEWVGHSDRR